MTMDDFLDAYRAEIVRIGTHTPESLDAYMRRVEGKNLPAQASTWSPHTPLAARAWKTAGGEGYPSRERLRALPRQSDHA